MTHHANGGTNSGSEEEKGKDGERGDQGRSINGNKCTGPLFLLPAVDAVPAWHFLQHPAPIPHALQLLRI